MQVKFTLGPTTAHAMKLDRDEAWSSLCGRVRTEDTRNVGSASPEIQPPKPWCKACVKEIQNHVEELYAIVLLPSAGAGSPEGSQ